MHFSVLYCTFLLFYVYCPALEESLTSCVTSTQPLRVQTHQLEDATLLSHMKQNLSMMFLKCGAFWSAHEGWEPYSWHPLRPRMTCFSALTVGLTASWPLTADLPTRGSQVDPDQRRWMISLRHWWFLLFSNAPISGYIKALNKVSNG